MLGGWGAAARPVNHGDPHMLGSKHSVLGGETAALVAGRARTPRQHDARPARPPPPPPPIRDQPPRPAPYGMRPSLERAALAKVVAALGDDRLAAALGPGLAADVARKGEVVLLLLLPILPIFPILPVHVPALFKGLLPPLLLRIPLLWGGGVMGWGGDRLGLGEVRQKGGGGSRPEERRVNGGSARCRAGGESAAA